MLADRLILDALVAPISRTWSGYWQRSAAYGVAGHPVAHPFALLDHANQLASSCMTQGLDDLEDNRVSERRVRRIQLALDHHPLC